VIDLHCHLLPGVDDGSRSVAQSVEVLHRMRETGVTAVCLTPHHTVGRVLQGLPATHDLAFAELAAAAPEGITLHRGVELMLDRPVPAEITGMPELRLAGTRYLLVEFTRLTALNSITSALQQVVQLGLVPLLAHPERYVCCNAEAVQTWKATGALMQVDATTLLTDRGRGRRARELLAAGLADIIAADNHGDDRSLGAAYRFLCEAGGSSQADYLARRNPAAILEGKGVESVPPLAFKTGLMDRLRALLDPDQ
jgi:protein-tyrosine phosphatase